MPCWLQTGHIAIMSAWLIVCCRRVMLYSLFGVQLCALSSHIHSHGCFYSGSSYTILVTIVALVHFIILLVCFCDGETLGCQGSDVLLSGGGKVLVEMASCIAEIDIYEVRVLLLVGNDGTHHLVTYRS